MKLSTFLSWASLVASLAVASVAFAMSGQPEKDTGAKRETRATQQLMDAASIKVGVPGISNFTEKRLMKMLYELRDQANLVTYTYFIDMTGRWHKVCPTTSIGYGMPFSAQFTAPSVDRVDTRGGSGASTTVTTQQPEPNGLYMPDSTAATWVICLGEDGKTLKPAYVEPQIIVLQEPHK